MRMPSWIRSRLARQVAPEACPLSLEVATDRTESSIVGLDGIAFASLERSYERSREHHVAWFDRHAVPRDLVGKPAYGRRRMIENSGREAGFFDLAVPIAECTDPSQ